MRDEEKYTNTEEQLLYLQKLLDEEDTAALNELFNELDILAIARTLESFPAKTRDLLWEYIPETMLGEVLAEVDEDIKVWQGAKHGARYERLAAMAARHAGRGHAGAARGRSSRDPRRWQRGGRHQYPLGS